MYSASTNPSRQLLEILKTGGVLVTSISIESQVLVIHNVDPSSHNVYVIAVIF